MQPLANLNIPIVLMRTLMIPAIVLIHAIGLMQPRMIHPIALIDAIGLMQPRMMPAKLPFRRT